MRKSMRRGIAVFSPPSGRLSRDKNTVLRLEALEDRALMTATATPTVTSDIDILGVTSNTPVGLTPAQVRTAYGFNNVEFGKVAGNGAGQTIAIVDAYNDPNIAADLAKFDATFGIAAPPSFKVENQNGGAALPATNATWDLEISLDVEWAHAIAPDAKIVLVEANSSNLGDLLAAVNTARDTAGVSVVSMSWGTSDFSGEQYFDSYFTTPAGHTGITFVASSGDSGAPSGWPALSSNVLAVGGTTLTLGSGSTYMSETAWGDSGGGVSLYETEPNYQKLSQSTGMRSAPDVAYDANPNTGFAVYDSVAYSGKSGWFEVGGTSAAAPQWGALIAIADQGRASVGLGTLNGAQSAIYSLPSSDFHDVTSGSNGYAAKSGYDYVTGRGSPIANLVIMGLIGSVPTPNAAYGALALTTKTTSGDDMLGGGSGDPAGAGSDPFAAFDVSASNVGSMQAAQQITSFASVAAVAQIGTGDLPLQLALSDEGPSPLDTGTAASGSRLPAELNGLGADNSHSPSAIDHALAADGLAGLSDGQSAAADSASRHGASEAARSARDAAHAAGAFERSFPGSSESSPTRNAGGNPAAFETLSPGEVPSSSAAGAIFVDPAAGVLETVWSQFKAQAESADPRRTPSAAAHPPAADLSATNPPAVGLANHAVVGLALAGMVFGWRGEPAEESVGRKPRRTPNAAG